ncbi:membrane protein [Nitratireductor aestuarii]|uniref:Membrane protein n=1 Tax=Nitratireductor aestuarii TaxID=1735103 RepID=A0A916W2W9_9HYPH|nr:DMT family transporter [Nitratireductor aestuarii]GGA61703.1 membrane protein [Nitratireductor aestuarii]
MHQSAYVLLVLTTLFWGGNAVAGRLALGHVSPFSLNLLRWGIMFLLLLPFGLKHVRRDWPVIRKNLWLMLFLGATGFTGFAAIMYKALEYTSAVNVSIEQAAIPMLIIVLNFVLFRLKATWLQILGFAISLVGVALTATHGELERLAQLDLNFGDALMLLAMCCYATYTAMLRLRPQIHWLSTATVFSFAGSLAAIPFLYWEYATGNAFMPDLQGWVIALYAAVFPSVLSQVFFIRGTELIGSNRAGLFVNLIPVFGTLLSVAILGEALHTYHVMALVFVVIGITIAEWSGRRAAGAKLP